MDTKTTPIEDTVDIDYTRNARFFDKATMKRINIIATIGWILSAIGLVSLLAVMFAHAFIFSLFSWPFLITGVVILCVILAKQVKESEIIGQMDGKIEQFTAICNEKWGFPNDFTDRSIVFSGCNLTEENLGRLKRLKNGHVIDTESEITQIYLDLDHKKVLIGRHRYSLVEDKAETAFEEFGFSEFDRSEITAEELGDRRINRFILASGDNILYSSPLSDTDYYKEDFIGSIVHQKSIRR